MIKMTSTLMVSADKLPFDEVTECLGTQPTLTHRREDARRPERAKDWWMLKVREIYQIPTFHNGEWDGPHPAIMTQLDQIHQAVADGAERFARWSQDHDVEVFIEVMVHSEDEDTPLMELTPDFMRLAVTLDATMSFGVYTNVKVTND